MNTVIRDSGFSSDNIDWFGNRYLTGNGRFGIRGTPEEFTAENRPAINLSGVYDRVPGKWRESVNAPNAVYTDVISGEGRIALPEKKPVFHEQSLDLSAAIFGRRTTWDTCGVKISVESERFASLDKPDEIWQRYRLTSDGKISLSVRTGIDPAVWDINGPHFVKTILTSDGKTVSAVGITAEKGFEVSAESVITACSHGYRVCEQDGKILFIFDILLSPGEEFFFEKCSKIKAPGDVSAPFEGGYDEAKLRHTLAWKKIWDVSEVAIEGDPEAELAMNYSIYHLNCIAPRYSESMSIPARGLSGQVYKGAIFWDTEMFMFDYFLFTDPAVARTFVRYRIDTLPGARRKAEEYGYDGAFYAWESHEGGIDACTDYNITDVFTGRPTRTYFRDKQVHVSSAMVYALDRYVTVTGDRTVLDEGGYDLIRECAAFYYSLLLKRVCGEEYEIRDVVGPDEYHERVDNNAYTNRMAKFTFDAAVKYLTEKGGEDETLIEKFADASEKIKIHTPDEKTGVIEQFDGYFGLEDVSVDEVRSRLLDPREYWGGANGVAAHTQVNKQADTVAMLGMFPGDYSTDVMRKNWEYYEKRTEHGSSLSACMFALLACYTGDPDYAYPLFMKSAQQDYLKTSKLWLGLIFIGGTHPAASGGAWMTMLRGFAGIYVKDGVPVSRGPALPSGWKKLSFRLKCRGRLWTVTATDRGTEIKELD
ncbi:MAG: glycoside hydrolase family 65 protein [Clostridia bacterium]|nr:glycoside hydrolase family 65 protein [Clostridia bacterium]